MTDIALDAFVSMMIRSTGHEPEQFAADMQKRLTEMKDIRTKLVDTERIGAAVLGVPCIYSANLGIAIVFYDALPNGAFAIISLTGEFNHIDELMTLFSGLFYAGISGAKATRFALIVSNRQLHPSVVSKAIERAGAPDGSPRAWRAVANSVINEPPPPVEGIA